jgi:hypothetical protein
MELVFILHHNILDAHTFSPLISLLIVIGGLYGSIRLVRDLLHAAGRAKAAFPPRPPSSTD